MQNITTVSLCLICCNSRALSRDLITLEMPSNKVQVDRDPNNRYDARGPVMLIKRVKIAHSFLQSVSDQFHVIISSLPM